MIALTEMHTHNCSLEWKRLADLPDAEGFAGSYAGVSNGALIVGGGANFPEKPLWEGGPKRWTDRLFVMLPKSSGWRDASPLPKRMGYGASVNLPQGMMIIGGCNQDGVFADCLLLSYEKDDVSCRPLAPLPVPLTGHAAAVMGGKVYVFGGSLQPGEQDARNNLYIYDPEADSWSEGPALPGRGRFLFQMDPVRISVKRNGGIRDPINIVRSRYEKTFVQTEGFVCEMVQSSCRQHLAERDQFGGDLFRCQFVSVFLSCGSRLR